MSENGTTPETRPHERGEVIERELADGPETQALQKAIRVAVQAYADFLERRGIIWEFGVDPEDPNWPRLKAQALVITMDLGMADGIDISLKDGAIDRVYGNGVNPDPYGFDGDPPQPI